MNNHGHVTENVRTFVPFTLTHISHLSLNFLPDTEVITQHSTNQWEYTIRNGVPTHGIY
jgi:hypothetical protein